VVDRERDGFAMDGTAYYRKSDQKTSREKQSGMQKEPPPFFCMRAKNDVHFSPHTFSEPKN
jgi:hypothetical protein